MEIQEVSKYFEKKKSPEEKQVSPEDIFIR